MNYSYGYGIFLSFLSFFSVFLSCLSFFSFFLSLSLTLSFFPPFSLSSSLPLSFFFFKEQLDCYSGTEVVTIAKYFIMQLSCAAWQVWEEPWGI